MLTLRQIEVIRAVMVTGTIAGAARLLNVAAPGLSRLMKHTEDSLGAKLFARRGGRFVPNPEARPIFAQINEVHQGLENLQFAIGALGRGKGAELRIGASPSIGNVMVPRAIADVRRRYPDLLINLDILKIEDTIDFLLLGRGEVAPISYRLDHPAIAFEPLARGELFCIVSEKHDLAGRARIAAREIAAYPLIGIDARDPYGHIMVTLFDRAKAEYRITVQARFGTSVCALVRQNLGIAVIDGFTLADPVPGIRIIPIEEPTTFQTYVAYRGDAVLSSTAAAFVGALRARMEEAHTAMLGEAGKGPRRVARPKRAPRRR